MERPRTVALAIRCFSLALLIGVTILWFSWGVPEVAVAAFVIVGGLIFGTARRQNWARWSLAILTVVVFVMTWSLIRFQLSFGIVVPMATVAQIALEAAGLYLLFRPAAGPWFRHLGTGDS